MATKVKEKISQPTTRPLEMSKNRSWMDFLSKETLNMYPGKDEWRQRIIYTLLMWGEKASSLEIMQFCMEYKIPYRTLKEWVAKYPDIKEAYDNVKLAVACHRRLGSMNKKLDGSYAYKDMHLYDPEWHQINKYHSDMKKDEEKQAHTFIISDAKPRVLSKKEVSEGMDDESTV